MRERPHLLFLNGRVPPPLNVGGDGNSIDTFLSTLASNGYSVDCNGVVNQNFAHNNFLEIRNQLSSKNISFIEKKGESISYRTNYPTTVHKDINLENFFERYLETHPNTFVLTQLDMAREILDISRNLNLPIIIFIRDAQANNYLTVQKFTKREDMVHIAFNSSYTRNKFSDVENYVGASIIYPPLHTERYQVSEHDPKYITMINPVNEKGGRIFYDLVKRFPDKNFLAVKGWYDPLRDGLDFSQLPNVTFWDKQDNVRRVYSQTKLLLVPSQWEEGFGRVAAEGLIAGIPVLASRNAGLIDALGSEGFYVDDFTSLEAWEERIKEVLSMSSTEIDKHVKNGKDYAKRFDSHVLTDKLELLINQLWQQK